MPAIVGELIEDVHSKHESSHDLPRSARRHHGWSGKTVKEAVVSKRSVETEIMVHQ